MSLMNILGWSVILDWLFGKKKTNTTQSYSNYHPSTGETFDKENEISKLEAKISATQSRLDRLEDKLYESTDTDSDEYAELEDIIDELQNDLYDMEDEADEMYDELDDDF